MGDKGGRVVTHLRKTPSWLGSFGTGKFLLVLGLPSGLKVSSGKKPSAALNSWDTFEIWGRGVLKLLSWGTQV